MYLKITVKILAFGDFASIGATRETISKLADLIQDNNFLPGVITEQPVFAPGSFKQFFSLATADESLRLNFLPDRVELLLNALSEDGLSEPEIESFIKKAPPIFHDVFSLFDLSANRLAFVTNDYLLSLSAEQEYAFFSKFPCDIQYYSSKAISEWRLSLGAEETVEIGDCLESISVITNLSKAVVVFGGTSAEADSCPIKKEGINILLDINTLPEHDAIRFSANHLGHFLDKATSIISTVIGNITRGVES
jgi:hypothetical protein